MDSFKQRLIVDIGNTFYKYLFGGIVLSCKDPKTIFENFKRVNIEIAVCYYSSVNKANLRKLKEAFKDSQFIELKNTVTEEELEKMKLIVDNFSYLGDDMFFDLCGGHASSLLVDIGTANKILYIEKDDLEKFFIQAKFNKYAFLYYTIFITQRPSRQISIPHRKSSPFLTISIC